MKTWPENETRRLLRRRSRFRRRRALQRLARAGFRVVGLEAGPFWDTEKDWVSDEKGSHELYWNDLRITGGTNPLALGETTPAKAVGGGSVHWAAFTPRFHPSDFRIYTEDGVGVELAHVVLDLKPWYELLEREMPVAGPAWFPLGRSARTSLRSASASVVSAMFLVRAVRSSASAPLPEARLLSCPASHGDRPHCIYRGFWSAGLQGRSQSQHADHPCAPTLSRPTAPKFGAHAMAARINLRNDGPRRWGRLFRSRR